MCPVEVSYWAEGPTDRAAARKLITAVGGVPGADYSRRRGSSPGKDYLDANIHRFNAAAYHLRWLVLRDSDGDCARELVADLLPEPAPLMRLRIVIPAIEAWLLADREEFGRFLSVSVNRIPLRPEDMRDVKTDLVQLARHSRSRSVREDILPVERSGRREGPGYASALIQFINSNWDPVRSSENADSLRRALERLRELVAV